MDGVRLSRCRQFMGFVDKSKIIRFSVSTHLGAYVFCFGVFWCGNKLCFCRKGIRKIGMGLRLDFEGVVSGKDRGRERAAMMYSA